jgi:hypothetical protein
MKRHPRKVVLIVVIIAIAVVLTQSGQHGQIGGLLSDLFG